MLRCRAQPYAHGRLFSFLSLDGCFFDLMDDQRERHRLVPQNKICGPQILRRVTHRTPKRGGSASRLAFILSKITEPSIASFKIQRGVKHRDRSNRRKTVCSNINKRKAVNQQSTLTLTTSKSPDTYPRSPSNYSIYNTYTTIQIPCKVTYNAHAELCLHFAEPSIRQTRENRSIDLRTDPL